MAVTDETRELGRILARLQEHGSSDEARTVVALARHVIESDAGLEHLIERLAALAAGQAVQIRDLTTRVGLLEKLDRN